MSNPVFNRIDKQVRRGAYAGFGQQPRAEWSTPQQPAAADLSAEQLQQMYDAQPATAAQARRMTLDDVVMKTLLLFGIVVAVAAASWVVTDTSPALALPIWLAGMLGGLVVGLVIAFRQKVSVPLILTYAVLEGGFVGAISRVFESYAHGVVGQAVLATMATFAGMFIAWKVGVIKVTDRSRRIFGMAVIGYLLFGLVNLVFAFATGGWGLIGSQFGLLICVVGVGMAAYSLAIDFDTIDRGVAAGLPERYSWLMAHGLIVSLVWLYLELLRLFTRARN